MTFLKRHVAKCKIGGSVIAAIAVGLGSTPAMSQTTNDASKAPSEKSVVPASSPSIVPATPIESDSQEGDIVVTGSRIGRAESTASVPVSVVSSAKIEATGASNVQDVLRELPSVGQGIGRSNTNAADTGNGVATVNLRNLGAARTLVLVDGRRFVSGVPGSSAVDLNAIPTDFVERVEVITGGASATYGSEAVAGVVNFILKDKFSGLKIRAQNSISSVGDAPRQYVTITAGKSFADGRGNIIVNGSYDNDHGLRSRDRDFSAIDIPNRSSFAAQGLFSPDGSFGRGASTFTFDQSNNLKQYQGANIDGYNRNQDRYLSLPVERVMGAGIANFRFSETFKAYAEFEYARMRSNAGREPQAVGSQPSAPDLDYPDGSPYNGIPITNIYIPATIRASMIANGVTSLPFRRRSNDIFDRSNRERRETWRGVIGLKGDLGGGLSYDIFYNHGQTIERTSSAGVLRANYRNALDSVQTANGPACRINVDANPNNNDPACVPINIFGFNTVTAAAANYLTAGGYRQTYNAKVTQDNISATITGKIFTLPAGDVKFAVGGEYRREKSVADFDALTNAGLTLGSQLADTVGTFTVKEGFGELLVPLIADKPFIKNLSLEAAARYADYSTIGGVWSYKVGGDYAPSSDIRFRAVYAQAIRAPNIGELYANRSQTFPAVVDPCDQAGGNGDGAALTPLSATCRAIPAIAATVARLGQFSYTTAQLQTITGYLGGNQNLRQETARTLTAGVVLTPSFLRGLVLSGDYYRIKVENAIGIIGQQVSLDQCVSTNNPIFCSNVTRNANGYVTSVDAVNANVGSYQVSGLDVQGSYQFNIGNARFQASTLWNHLFKQEQTPYPGGPIQKEVGQLSCFSCGRLGTGFRDRVAAAISASYDGFSINWRANYQSAVVDTLDSPTATKVGSYWYHNFQVSKSVGDGERFKFLIGVNNVFDKKPPVLGDTNVVSYPGTATAADSYDLIGRMLYAGVTVSF